MENIERSQSTKDERSRGRCDTSGQSGIIRAEGDKSESCMFQDLDERRGRRRRMKRRSQTCRVQFGPIDSANNQSAVQARLPAHWITSSAWSTMVFCLTGSALTSGLRSHSRTLLSSFHWIIASLQKSRLNSTRAAIKENWSLRDFQSFNWLCTVHWGTLNLYFLFLLCINTFSPF